MNTFKSLFRRYGLEVAVVTIGIVLAAGSGEPGGAAMIAALAYVVASAFLELRRHRWLGLNAALAAAALVLAAGPATALYSGGDNYWSASLIALAVLVVGYVVWLVVNSPWQPCCCCRRYRSRLWDRRLARDAGQGGAVAAATTGVAAGAAAWAHDDDDWWGNDWWDRLTSPAYSYDPTNIWHDE